MTYQQIIKSYRIINYTLGILITLLILFQGIKLYDNYQTYHSKIEFIQSPKTIQIISNTGSISLLKKENTWMMNAPFQTRASETVINAITGNLATTCSNNYPSSSIHTSYYAKIIIDQLTYEVGEINQTNNQIYIKQGNHISLCNKIILSIALAPAINFIDKNIYHGNLQQIKSVFGELTEFSDLDLSVLSISEANVSATKEASIGFFEFKTDQEKIRYEVVFDVNQNHLILVNPNTKIAYIISASPKLRKILGI